MNPTEASSTLNITETLDHFLSEREHSVLVFRGAWGVGKTYFWEDYIKKKIENKRVKQIVYSYVSLFGLCSNSDLKEKILYSGRITKDKNEVKIKLEESSSKKEKIVDV